MSTSNLPRIVILGAGFGGLFAARGLASAKAEITVIDRNNYHLFQPLLYQVAGAGLSPSDVAWPIRSLLSRQSNTRVCMAEVCNVDTEQRRVMTHQGKFPYDYLLVATGSETSYFGNDEWRGRARSLKNLADAADIRQQVLEAFECAELMEDGEDRRRFLTFAVIGGGPTGVELAGNIAELGRQVAASDFRHIDAHEIRVLLIEGGDCVLSTFPEKLSRYTERALSELGVEVLTGKPVERIEADFIEAGGETIPANTVLWCAGVTPTPAADWLGVATEKDGRIRVDEQLRVPDLNSVYVMGDLAWCEDEDGDPLPGLAPVAKQQGAYIAQRIEAEIAGESAFKPFQYRDYGTLATIGRGRAIADFGFIRSKGFITWWLWGITHIYYLIGRRSRITVLTKWLWEYLNYERGSRLILNRNSRSNE